MSCKNDAFTRMVHGIYEVLLRTHQTHEQSRPNQLLLHSSGVHTTVFSSTLQDINGPARARNTNLSPLVSSKPILIELLGCLVFTLRCFTVLPAPLLTFPTHECTCWSVDIPPAPRVQLGNPHPHPQSFPSLARSRV